MCNLIAGFPEAAHFWVPGAGRGKAGVLMKRFYYAALCLTFLTRNAASIACFEQSWQGAGGGGGRKSKGKECVS